MEIRQRMNKNTGIIGLCLLMSSCVAAYETRHLEREEPEVIVAPGKSIDETADTTILIPERLPKSPQLEIKKK